MSEAEIDATSRIEIVIANAVRALGRHATGRRQWGSRFPFDRVGAISLACAALFFALAVGVDILLR